MPAETAEAAETRIHKGINTDWEITPDERKKWESDPLHHPLQDKWVKGMDDVEAEKVDAQTACWKDCKERTRIHKLECDEVRRRVERKLKDLGCPTTLIANDLPSMCGEDPAAAVVETVAPQQQMGMGMGMPAGGYYPYYPGYPPRY
jgi:hypothetical protein